ncbi:MAG: DUF2782 domain-containing protein [Magnetococcales bacterium]|nr:DUF2782 domain-containing protein [Magnetococcales bacterium]
MHGPSYVTRFLKHLIIPFWVLGMLFPLSGSAEDSTSQSTTKATPTVTPPAKRDVNPDGYPLPAKGVLIATLREDISEEIEGPETEIRIFEDEMSNRVTEFYVKGQRFQLEITSAAEPGYVLVDNNGDGVFESRYDTLTPRIILPHWVLRHHPGDDDPLESTSDLKNPENGVEGVEETDTFGSLNPDDFDPILESDEPVMPFTILDNEMTTRDLLDR